MVLPAPFSLLVLAVLAAVMLGSRVVAGRECLLAYRVVLNAHRQGQRPADRRQSNDRTPRRRTGSVNGVIGYGADAPVFPITDRSPRATGRRALGRGEPSLVSGLIAGVAVAFVLVA